MKPLYRGMKMIHLLQVKRDCAIQSMNHIIKQLLLGFCQYDESVTYYKVVIFHYIVSSRKMTEFNLSET